MKRRSVHQRSSKIMSSNTGMDKHFVLHTADVDRNSLYRRA
jgi:hypothetical protein